MILFLKPNDKERQFGQLKEISAVEPPLWLAVFRKMFDGTVVLDAEAEDLDLRETVDTVRRLGPDKVIMIPTGNHPSAQVQQLDMAYIVRQLLRAARIPCEVWDKLPQNPIELGGPDWTGLRMGLYRGHRWHCDQMEPYGVVYTSVSCPYKCSFCLTNKWYGTQYKERPIDDVLEDLFYWRASKTRNIKIMDELFMTVRQKELLQEMAKVKGRKNIWCYARLDCLSGLDLAREAGIKWVAVGVESGAQSIRAKYGKGRFTNKTIAGKIKDIQSAGIKVLGNFIFGFPEDTVETMQRTLDFAISLKCDHYNLYSMMAYPGTGIHALALQNNWDIPKSAIEFSQYSFKCKPLRTYTLTGKEVLNFRDDAFKILYPGDEHERVVREI